MKEKEKLIQIYEVVSEKALEEIKVGIDDYAFELIRTAQSLYETISSQNQPILANTSMLDVSDN